MSLSLIFPRGKSEAWLDDAAVAYEKKIAAMVKFQRVAIKSKSGDRDRAEEKRQNEGAALLEKIRDQDYLILLSERGRTFKNSREFSEILVKRISAQRPVAVVIGGPYGVSEDIVSRADEEWSLSGLTMNHHVAQLVALEQIYRGLAIWKNLPYHND